MCERGKKHVAYLANTHSTGTHEYSASDTGISAADLWDRPYRNRRKPCRRRGCFSGDISCLFQANKTFQEEEHRKAWLIRTACNHCKKITGSTYRKRTVPLTDTTPLPILFSLPEDNRLFSALCSLKPMYRNVLYLHYFAGYRTEEIAKLLGKRAGTIRMQLLRGREQLRNQLQEEEEPVYEPKAMQTHV